MATHLVFIEERTIQMSTDERALLSERIARAQEPQRLLVCRDRAGGHDACRSVASMCRDHSLEGLFIAVHKVGAITAVNMHVHETGRNELPGDIQRIPIPLRQRPHRPTGRDSTSSDMHSRI